MNSFLAVRSRAMAGCFRRWVRVLDAVCFLALAGAAGALILGHSHALAQQERPAAQRGNPPAGNTATAPAGNAQNGKQLFTRVGCDLCHNADGQGGGGAPRLAPPNMIPFPAFVRQHREPANSMPPYTSKVLSDAQLADIYAFLQTIPKPPEASSIPLLQQ